MKIELEGTLSEIADRAFDGSPAVQRSTRGPNGRRPSETGDGAVHPQLLQELQDLRRFKQEQQAILQMHEAASGNWRIPGGCSRSARS